MSTIQFCKENQSLINKRKKKVAKLIMFIQAAKFNTNMTTDSRMINPLVEIKELMESDNHRALLTQQLRVPN